MKLLTGRQIREWDAFTIKNEPISSIDLMERASRCFTDWFVRRYPSVSRKVLVFCGNGNNGGDGLAIARMLRDNFYDVQVLILRFAGQDTTDFDLNLGRLMRPGDVPVIYIHDTMPVIPSDSILIDALMGTGVSRTLTGTLADLIMAINKASKYKLISVDIPSGMPTEGLVTGPAIEASETFTFQVPKLSFFLPENDKFCPSWTVGDIGLLPQYLTSVISEAEMVDQELAASVYHRRTRFQHKGDFGHALLMAGSPGKVGAAVLASRACLYSGAGLVTACIPAEAAQSLIAAIPEAMTLISGNQHFTGSPLTDPDMYTIGVGPGLGTHQDSIQALAQLLPSVKKPMVIDADALNILALEPSLWDHIPAGSILTPHPGEFRRLFGDFVDSMQMFDIQIQKAEQHDVIIVLKGAFTRIATPHGKVYINNTGNPGMATAGSGDVLTGIITGLLAQKYAPEQAAILGVWLHGKAGDLAADHLSQEALTASDITGHLGQAYKSLSL